MTQFIMSNMHHGLYQLNEYKFFVHFIRVAKKHTNCSLEWNSQETRTRTEKWTAAI